MKVSKSDFVKEIVDGKKLIEYQTRSYREDVRESNVVKITKSELENLKISNIQIKKHESQLDS